VEKLTTMDFIMGKLSKKGEGKCHNIVNTGGKTGRRKGRLVWVIPGIRQGDPMVWKETCGEKKLGKQSWGGLETNWVGIVNMIK